MNDDIREAAHNKIKLLIQEWSQKHTDEVTSLICKSLDDFPIPDTELLKRSVFAVLASATIHFVRILSLAEKKDPRELGKFVVEKLNSALFDIINFDQGLITEEEFNNMIKRKFHD